MSDTATISSFRGDFGFLSNFHEASLWLDGEQYRSVEHAYQAAKATDPDVKRLIREAKTPGAAKKLGRAVQLPPDWDVKKLDVMRRAVQEKFRNPLLRALLIATEDAEITHENTWNDTFFGVCRGRGQDWLGKILMEVRGECVREETK